MNVWTNPIAFNDIVSIHRKREIVILFVKGQIKSRPEGQKNRRRLQARAKRVTVGGGFSDPMVET